jgi:hypothetical protein
MSIKIDEITDNNGKIHNCLHGFTFQDGDGEKLELFIFMYKINFKKTPKGRVLSASIYWSNDNKHEPIADIFADFKIDDEVLSIIKKDVGGYLALDIINKLKGYLERVCHEIIGDFGYSLIEYQSPKK